MHTGISVQNVRIELCGATSKSAGSLEVETFSSLTRLKRTIWTVIGGLALTILLTFIPILHFVLVPLGLLGTLFVASFRNAQRNRVLSGTGTCPECKASFTIYARPFSFPFVDLGVA
jgi:hypothetical protein